LAPSIRQHKPPQIANPKTIGTLGLHQCERERYFWRSARGDSSLRADHSSGTTGDQERRKRFLLLMATLFNIHPLLQRLAASNVSWAFLRCKKALRYPAIEDWFEATEYVHAQR
jgi:hypothetical protein